MSQPASDPPENAAQAALPLSGDLLSYVAMLSQRATGIFEFRTGAGRIYRDLLMHWPTIEEWESEAQEICQHITDAVYPLASALYAQAVEIKVIICKKPIEPPSHIDGLSTYIVFDLEQKVERHAFLTPTQDLPHHDFLRTAKGGIVVLCRPLNYRYHTIKDDRKRGRGAGPGWFELSAKLSNQLAAIPFFSPADKSALERLKTEIKAAPKNNAPGAAPNLPKIERTLMAHIADKTLSPDLRLGLRSIAQQIHAFTQGATAPATRPAAKPTPAARASLKKTAAAPQARPKPRAPQTATPKPAPIPAKTISPKAAALPPKTAPAAPAQRLVPTVLAVHPASTLSASPVAARRNMLPQAKPAAMPVTKADAAPPKPSPAPPARPAQSLSAQRPVPAFLRPASVKPAARPLTTQVSARPAPNPLPATPRPAPSVAAPAPVTPHPATPQPSSPTPHAAAHAPLHSAPRAAPNATPAARPAPAQQPAPAPQAAARIEARPTQQPTPAQPTAPRVEARPTVAPQTPQAAPQQPSPAPAAQPATSAHASPAAAPQQTRQQAQQPALQQSAPRAERAPAAPAPQAAPPQETRPTPQISARPQAAPRQPAPQPRPAPAETARPAPAFARDLSPRKVSAEPRFLPESIKHPMPGLEIRPSGFYARLTPAVTHFPKNPSLVATARLDKNVALTPRPVAKTLPPAPQQKPRISLKLMEPSPFPSPFFPTLFTKK